MLQTLIFNSVVLYPTLNYLVRKRKGTYLQKLGLTLAFMLVLIAGLCLYRMRAWEPNYFHVLGVPRDADSKAIKQAYRKLSLELHPDKNPSEEAANQFMVVTKAYNTLLNDQARDAYDRFGPIGQAWVEQSQNIYQNGLQSFIVETLMHLVLAYMVSTGGGRDSNSYAYAAVGLFTAAIAGMRFGQEDLFVPFAPWMTRHEKCELLNQALSFVVIAVNVWQSAHYLDWEAAMLYRLREIELAHMAILTRLGSDPNLVARVRNANPAVASTPVVPEAPQKFKLPSIPSWAWFLIVMGVSHYMSDDSVSGNRK